ncbi:hypothetical protein [Sciscionella marina]|uniref:hypothetical protein n=1 Tax=Sciscionella marina TaxID=508770 RepID=UPI000363EA1A|nr:hypothetical protein [Sciscionella marina]
MTIRTRLGRRRAVRPPRLLAVLAAVLLAVSLGSVPASAAGEQAIPGWQKYEPKGYDTSPLPKEKQARVATPQDTGLDKLNGEIVISWWKLKNPKDPKRSLFLLEAEPGWKQPRQIGQQGTYVWAIADEANEEQPQFPFLNGIISFKRGLPFGGSPGTARIDGKPGLRGNNLSFDHDPAANTWHVQGQSPNNSANFTVDQVVPGSVGSYYPPDGHTTGPTNVDAVANGRVHGSLTLNGRKIDLDGWRTNYWRMNMFPSVFDSQLNPATSWRGWEWNMVLEPDGGASQYYAMMDPSGRMHDGYLVDARPSGTRVCSRITMKFGDYHWGRSMFGDISPPFQRYTIPGWIKVKCAPGEKVQMEKTFYPDSRDYVDAGLLTATEMPMHTVPGSFGTYEHMRYSTYRAQKFAERNQVSQSAQSR